MNMKKLAYMGIVPFFIFFTAIYPSYAQDNSSEGPNQVDQMMGEYNLYPPLEKLGRGLANALGGWLEIPLGVHERYTQTDTASSMFNGLLVGLVKGVARTGVGVYEAVTFFLPYPEDFVPILPTLAYFDKANRQEPLPLE